MSIRCKATVQPTASENNHMGDGGGMGPAEGG
jgi:hypothetical protein